MKFFTYKGYPLVRSGNQLYYGDMSEKYVVSLTIEESKNVGGEEVASRIRIVQMDTTEKDPMKAFVRNAVQDCGLYEALDFARVWLDKALGK